MNPVFIAFCILTVLSAIGFITTTIGIKCINNEDYKEILLGSLVLWGGTFILFIFLSACAWKSKEEQYQYCMYKVNNIQYCTDRYLIKR